MSGTEVANIVKRDTMIALFENSPEIEALKFNCADSPLKASDLVKVKNPSGGATAWGIEGSGGIEYVTKLRGVILYMGPRRQLWESKGTVGSGERPVCSSNDNVKGRLRTNEDKSIDVPQSILDIAIPGNGTGDCASCKFNEWGTGVDEKGNPTRGKRCQENHVMLFLRENDVLPLSMTVPTGSIGDFSAWKKKLPGLRYDRCLVELTLAKDNAKAAGGKQGAPYAKYVPAFVGKLDPDACVALGAYYDLIVKPVVDSLTVDNRPTEKKKTDVPDEEKIW
jgi:hypothetical protein